MIQLDLNSVSLIRQNLPAFGKISPQQPPIEWLDAYLSLYKLPALGNSLAFYCGTLQANQQSVLPPLGNLLSLRVQPLLCMAT